MGYSWEFALTAVFLEGIVFVLLTAFNIRELIINSIPTNLKHAVSAGIGLFIAFIGLKSTGLIVDHPATLVALGDMKSPAVLVGLAGLVITGFLLIKNIKGAILIGILSATIIGIFCGVTNIPEGFKAISAHHLH